MKRYFLPSMLLTAIALSTSSAIAFSTTAMAGETLPQPMLLAQSERERAAEQEWRRQQDQAEQFESDRREREREREAERQRQEEREAERFERQRENEEWRNEQDDRWEEWEDDWRDRNQDDYSDRDENCSGGGGWRHCNEEGPRNGTWRDDDWRDEDDDWRDDDWRDEDDDWRDGDDDWYNYNDPNSGYYGYPYNNYPYGTPYNAPRPDSSSYTDTSDWAEVTFLETGSDWTTVVIQGRTVNQEITFAQDSTRTLSVMPGTYYLRFRDAYSNAHWEAGYLVLDDDERVEIVMDGDRNQIQVDEPELWQSERAMIPGDRSF